MNLGKNKKIELAMKSILNERMIGKLYGATCLLVCILMNSCTVKEQDYGGESVNNYPNNHKLFEEYMQPYEKEPYTVMQVNRVDKKNDTTYLPVSKVNWQEWNQPFLDADINKKELDKQYKISVTSDTISASLTLVFTSLNPENLTQKMSITRSTAGDVVKNVYMETRDLGFLSSKEYKISFIPAKSIQIQERIKKPFSGLKTQIRTLYFLN